MAGTDAKPGRDCPRCSRLAAFRKTWRAKEPTWFNAPVPSFGRLDSRLLIVGLAPGLRGANRTGRPFTGDYAGDLLYATLLKFGFARGSYAARPDDGLQLIDCRIANAVRCVPPENKPAPAEFAQCRSFLQSEIGAMPEVRIVLALGKGAHDQILRALAIRPAVDFAFRHTRPQMLTAGVTLADSYHCSRYNTNTGRLTPVMFADVLDG